MAPMVAGYRLLKLKGSPVKWGEQRFGADAKISYAFADETLRFDDARNCGVLAPMKALSRQGLPLETLVQETAAAFRTWERAADLSFHQVADARDAGIILGAQGQPRRRAFANVTFAPHDKGGVRTICLNHPGPSRQVMGFRYTERFPGLQTGDLRGIRHLYGDRASDRQLATGTNPRFTESAL
ncbi:MAG: hypothetical protein R6W86_05730 [Marinobacter sp.]|uniref:hypothetical protein n=1 Tax=Marinobacter sp. TaxID=50741 RepID=UPI00396E9F18